MLSVITQGIIESQKRRRPAHLRIDDVKLWAMSLLLSYLILEKYCDIGSMHENAGQYHSIFSISIFLVLNFIISIKFYFSHQIILFLVLNSNQVF